MVLPAKAFEAILDLNSAILSDHPSSMSEGKARRRIRRTKVEAEVWNANRGLKARVILPPRHQNDPAATEISVINSAVYLVQTASAVFSADTSHKPIGISIVTAFLLQLYRVGVLCFALRIEVGASPGIMPHDTHFCRHEEVFHLILLCSVPST